MESIVSAIIGLEAGNYGRKPALVGKSIMQLRIQMELIMRGEFYLDD